MADLTSKEREDLPASKFAVPGKRKLPLSNASHIKLAWSQLGRTNGLTSGEIAEARKRILAAAKEQDIDTSDWDKPREMSDSLVTHDVEVLTDGVEAGQPLKIRVKGTRANVVNENNRMYPLDVLTDAVKRFKMKLPVWGESPHPESKKDKNQRTFFDTKLENNVTKIVDCYVDSNDVWYVAEVLNTHKGIDLRALVDAKGPIPTSARMLGSSVPRNINGVMVDVATRLDIHSFDIVMNGATPGCAVEEAFTDSQVAQIFQDGLCPPMCPHCGAKLEEMDPDNDGDIDFLACRTCHAAYIEDCDTAQTTNHTRMLRKVTPDNYDRYGLAREWLNPKPGIKMTDAVKEEDPSMTQEELAAILANQKTELLAAMADSLEKATKSAAESVAHQAKEAAEAAAKPALDALEAQKRAGEEVATKARFKSEARAFLDEKLGSLKGAFDDKAINVIADTLGEPESKEMAEAQFDAVLKTVNELRSKKFLDHLGFTEANAGGAGGQVRFDVEVTREGRPWMAEVERLCDAMDDQAATSERVIDPSLRKYNNEHLLGKLMKRAEEVLGHQALTDSVEGGKLRVMKDGVQSGELFSDSVSVTTSQVFNQPTIALAILVQAYQDCEFTQFALTDVFKGQEWRQSVESRTSAAAYNNLNFLLDLFVSEGAGIPNSAINLSWLTFQPIWRRNAISLSEEVIHQMQSGPLNYNAIARALYHLSDDKRVRVDNAGYAEMIQASDEYQPLVITTGSPESPVAGSVAAVTVNNAPAGTNAAYVLKLNPATSNAQAPTFATGTSYGAGNYVGGNPVVRPRTFKQLQTNGSSTTTTSNPFVVKVNNTGSPLVMGIWDGVNINNIPGSGTAQYAVDFEHGLVYFMATGTSGINPTASTPLLPTLSYSAVTNMDRWSYSIGAGYTDISAWYDTLLQQISRTKATMGSSPRFRTPNTAIFSLNSAAFVKNARIMFQAASPNGTKLLDTGNTFAMRENINFSEINAPWIAQDGRILLTRKGATRYGIETPYNVKGPFPVYDSGQLIVDAEQWRGSENSVLCTPIVLDGSGNQQNPPSRSIVLGAS